MQIKAEESSLSYYLIRTWCEIKCIHAFPNVQKWMQQIRPEFGQFIYCV